MDDDSYETELVEETPFSQIAAQKLSVPNRRKKVFLLRDEGLDWPEVAERLGVSVRTAQRDWCAGIVEAGKSIAKIALVEELQQIDDSDRRMRKLAKANMERAMEGDKGSVAAVGVAEGVLAKNREHRAKYLGLFKPEKVEHSGGITLEDLDALRRRVEDNERDGLGEERVSPLLPQ